MRRLALAVTLLAAACAPRRVAMPETPNPAAAGAAARLELDVAELAGKIGERNLAHPEALRAAADLVSARLSEAGLSSARQPYAAGKDRAENVVAVVPSSPGGGPVLVVGAHYDTAAGTPGADDNASGVAGLLELARRFRARPAGVELRLVFFSTEEPPNFGREAMGSRAYARALKKEGRSVVGMASLEMLGYYSDARGSQDYPPLVGVGKPDKGDFIGLVSNLPSRQLLHKLEAGYLTEPRATTLVAQAMPELIGESTLSDHWSFWKEGFSAVMFTDTAFLRNHNYHEAGDTPATLDYKRLAATVDGIEAAIRAL